MKTLTISIAAYNAKKTINKCLDSMVSSKCIDDLEIIVVNDGSKDKTLDIAKDYSQQYPQSVIVIDKENGGHGSTINASIIKATGKYYKIVDSDDWVETESLDKLVDTLKTESADLIVNSYFEADANGNHTKLIKASDYTFQENTIYNFEDIALHFTKAHMHKMTFKTNLVKEMGPIIDENCFYVDIEYVGFLLSKIDTVKFLEYPVYDYLLGYDEQSASIISMVERRDQHKKVVNRMIEFYQSSKSNSNRSEFMRRFVASFVGRQYKIYLFMPVDEGKMEFREFDKTIPDCFLKSPGIRRELLPVVKLIRFHNGILFTPIAKAVQFFLR